MQSRKHAQGADAPLQQPQQPFNTYSYPAPPPADMTSSLGDPSYFDWNQGEGMNSMANQYPDQPIYDANLYNAGLNDNVGTDTGASLNQPIHPGSNQLVRRNPNQQLATRGRPAWQDSATGLRPPQPSWEHGDDEDEQELEQRAAAAKRVALANRKQIPPFVQKLSRCLYPKQALDVEEYLQYLVEYSITTNGQLYSFLDDGKNTDLIRWSDDGRSFIVVDEDEFAKTLIPELFKHNNYASFVRQLNMYGFHKKVGLSDNSMKASENKRKTPSEYYNKYFRRGRPDLLWLIQKPKVTPSAKRKRDDGKAGAQPDSDEEGRAGSVGVEGHEHTGGEIGRTGSQDLTTIPKSELTGLRQELVGLQRQQKIISGLLGQLKRQNEQLYQQATAFQTLHERHESSINAILTFLATFYNRSLEGHGNANIADMFTHVPQNTTQQGNVVEMPDLPMDINAVNTFNRTRRPLLLPPPESKRQAGSPAATISSSTRSTVSPKPRNQPTPIFRPQGSSSRPDSGLNSTLPVNTTPSPALKDDARPSHLGNTDDVMSMINAANATSPASTIDFNSALEQYQNANGKGPLTPQQRSDMLSMMAHSTGAANASSLATAGANVLTNPPPPVPQVSDIAHSAEQLEYLQRLQDEQAQKVQSLADRLGSLSPSGTIPGIHDDSIPPPLPNNIDFDDWLNDPNNENFPFLDINQDAANFDFSAFDNLNGGDQSDLPHPYVHDNEELFPNNNHTQNTGGGRVESVSSRATTPSRAYAEDDGTAIPVRKRTRKS